MFCIKGTKILPFCQSIGELRISPLCARLPSPPHSQNLHGQTNVRISGPGQHTAVQEQTTVTSHVKDLPSSEGISVRPSDLLPFWRIKPTGSLATGAPAAVRKLEQRHRSACDVWTIYQGPVCRQAVQTAGVDRRAVSTKVRDTQVQPLT